MSAAMRSLEVPYLPDDAPEMDTPDEFEHELYPHQKRALHRMCSLERDPSFLEQRFKGKALGTHLDYLPKGGVLCDGVGMGKTAVVLALLVAEPRDATQGPNLLLAPSHLLHQWTRETLKFCPKGVRVITGLKAYRAAVTSEPEKLDNRTLVVVDAKSVLSSSTRHHYDFRRLFKRTTKGELEQVPLSPEASEMYKRKAVFISRGYKGPMYGHGGPQQKALFFPQCVLGGGRTGFRRVLFDEIQDLVEEGREEKDCLLQLTQHTRNVWLVTATPFPAAANSVYANHQLLGFRRLRVFCESPDPLPRNAPFEIIKRSLYIRSHETARTDAIKVRHEVRVHQVELTPIEHMLYKMMVRKARLGVDEDAEGEVDLDTQFDESVFWDEHFWPMRAGITHPAASVTVREGLRENRRGPHGSFRVHTPTAHGLAVQKSDGMPGLAGEIAARSEADRKGAEVRVQTMKTVEIPALENSIRLAKHLIAKGIGILLADKAQLRPFLVENDFTMLRGKKSTMHTTIGEVAKFCKSTLAKANLNEYLSSCTKMLRYRERRVVEITEMLPDMAADECGLKALLSQPAERGRLALYGTKLDRLLRLLQDEIPAGQKIVLFSNFDDTLKIVAGILKRQDVLAVRLDGTAESRGNQIHEFVTDAAVRVLLVSMRLSAAGTNLQVAQHVVFLDTPGRSSAEAAALVIQATGRVIRMGQEKPVTIHHLIANDTVEVQLSAAMLEAVERAKSVDQNSSYKVDNRPVDLGPVERKSSALVFEGVEVMRQETLEERLLRALTEAEASGKVLDLADDPDDGPGDENVAEEAPKQLRDARPQAEVLDLSGGDSTRGSLGDVEVVPVPAGVPPVSDASLPPSSQENTGEEAVGAGAAARKRQAPASAESGGGGGGGVVKAEPGLVAVPTATSAAVNKRVKLEQ